VSPEARRRGRIAEQKELGKRFQIGRVGHRLSADEALPRLQQRTPKRSPGNDTVKKELGQ
jgi:hypothetical protein